MAVALNDTICDQGMFAAIHDPTSELLNTSCTTHHANRNTALLIGCNAQLSACKILL